MNQDLKMNLKMKILINRINADLNMLETMIEEKGAHLKIQMEISMLDKMLKANFKLMIITGSRNLTLT
jgi:hypothetical protein